MKVILVIFVSIILVIGATACSWYYSDYEGRNYYIRIPEKIIPIDEREICDRNRKLIQYTYLFKGFNEKHEGKELKFYTFYKLKSNSYLEVFLNKKGEIVKLKEKKRNEIPRNALKDLG